MRTRLLCVLALSLALMVPLLGGNRALAQEAPTLQAQDFVAVCGDSITEQKLYSLYIADYMLMCQPAANMRVMQAGWGGEVAHGFLPRMERDVLALHPTAVTTCYGMNDGGYGPFDPGRGKLYRDTHQAIVQGLRKAGVRLIVIGSPGVVDSNTFRGGGQPAEVYNATLAKFGDLGKEVATEEKVTFADVHGVMMDVMAKAKAKYGPTYAFAGGDGVHPGPNGHLVMAYAFLKALGCKGEVGTITLDLAANKAEATDGHKVLACANGAVDLESTRYPFCFFGDPASPNATRGIIEFFPFNDDLNRFRLVVKGADAAKKYKVTWGAGSKEFTGEALGQGINLAAEFLDNPFCAPFQKAEQAIRQQQEYETGLTKTILHLLPIYRDVAPEENAALDRIAAKAIARDQALATASSAAIQPVQHTVKVEVVP
ncbi:MAG: SGNH/GDSL hydrolase family protein [Armatimonadota bacterium]